MFSQRNTSLEASRPWRAKLWIWLSTLGLGVAAALLAQIPALAALAIFDRRGLSSALASDGVAVILTICVSTPVQVGLLVWFARRRSASAIDYLALRLPSPRALGLLALGAVALLAATDGLSWLLAGNAVTSFQSDVYRSARAAGATPWLWLTIVVAAPIGEELLFRGFLFRGWQTAAGTPWAAIVATAALWAIVHVQYSVIVIAQVMLVGLAFGWVRWATGSTISTILLHACLNAAGLAETYFSLQN